MEKRLPIALLLSLLFIWWYSRHLQPPAPPAGTEQGSTLSPAAPPTTDLSGLGVGPGQGAAADYAPGRQIYLKGSGYIAQFDTRGASVAALELTDYHTEPGGDVDLRILGRVDGVRGNFLLRDMTGQYGLDRADWQDRVETLDDGRTRIVFTHRTGDGLLFTRTVTDTGRPFEFLLEIQVEAPDGAVPGGSLALLQEGPRGILAEHPDSSFLSTPPTALAIVRKADGEATATTWSKGSLKDGTPRTVADGEVLLGAGSMNNYFASILAPETGTWVGQVLPAAVLDAAALDLAVAKESPPDALQREALRRQLAEKHEDNAAADLLLTSTPPAPGKPLHFGFTVFAGPKDRSLAERPGYDFVGPMIEQGYGRMAWINHGLLAILQFFERLTGNWGFAIILLTLVVRLSLFPLSRAQQSSMLKYSETMKRLKPTLDALKEKYKGNSRKYNEEQMKLMKAEGVRPPLGGCLLMFVQLPVWWALFQVLRSALELRHAPFVGWIQDLSRPDQMPFGFFGLATLNVLPILMAGAQVMQLRLQPPPADETQAQTQKLMGMFMPVMMLFLLYRYPSGLSLYIFTSSLWGILEYRVVRRYWPPSGALAAAAAKDPKRKPARL